MKGKYPFYHPQFSFISRYSVRFKCGYGNLIPSLSIISRLSRRRREIIFLNLPAGDYRYTQLNFIFCKTSFAKQILWGLLEKWVKMIFLFLKQPESRELFGGKWFVLERVCFGFEENLCLDRQILFGSFYQNDNDK